jgi:AcrR family transcriptional regulator
MRKPGSRGPQTLRNLRTAAIQLLAERSYEGMNLRLLASKLRLQAGSLYNYIESKQQLLFWLMKDSTEKLLREFEATIAPIDDPAQQMLKFVGFHVGYHITNRKEASVLLTEMRSLTPQNNRAIKQLQRLYTDKVQEIVERGGAAGKFAVDDSRIATFVLLQMLTSVARWYRPRGRLTVPELMGVYTDLVFAMLGASRPAEVALALNGTHPGEVQYNGAHLPSSTDGTAGKAQLAPLLRAKGNRPTSGAPERSSHPSDLPQV